MHTWFNLYYSILLPNRKKLLFFDKSPKDLTLETPAYVLYPEMGQLYI